MAKAKVSKKDQDQMALSAELRSGYFTDETVIELIKQGVPKEMYETLQAGCENRVKLAQQKADLEERIEKVNLEELMPIMQVYDVKKLQIRLEGTVSYSPESSYAKLDKKLLTMNLLNRGMKPEEIQTLLEASSVDTPRKASVAFRPKKSKE